MEEEITHKTRLFRGHGPLLPRMYTQRGVGAGHARDINPEMASPFDGHFGL